MRRKIPTLLGLVLVVFMVAGVAVTTRAFSQVTRIFSRAQQRETVQSVAVANITDSSFTVVWTTEVDLPSSVFYGRSPNLGDGVARDEREANASGGKYRTHLVRVLGLSPGTKYYFKIGAGSGEDAPFALTTGPKLAETTATEPIFGKVVDRAKVGVSGAIAVWEANGAGKIAALSRTDGNYVLPIANVRTEDGSKYFTLELAATEKITLLGQGQTVVITCQSGKDRPLPTVSLGDVIDCSSGGAASFKPPAGATGGAILTPQVNISEGETVSNPLPTFSGKALPNQVVKILVQSDTPMSGTVVADSTGSWSWTPPANLSVGQHTVTITIVNPDGTEQTVVRSFTVTAGAPILPITSGTPSAQLTHMTCVANACVRVSGLGADTCVSDNDCVSSPSAAPPPAPPPATGAWENTFVLLTFGALFLTVGLLYGFRSATR